MRRIKLRRVEGKLRRAEENSEGRSTLLKTPSENPGSLGLLVFHLGKILNLGLHVHIGTMYIHEYQMVL